MSAGGGTRVGPRIGGARTHRAKMAETRLRGSNLTGLLCASNTGRGLPESYPVVDSCAVDAPLRERRCRCCKRLFYICRRCDRGHAYCGPSCRIKGHRKNRDSANLRFRRTDEGRANHADRQRRYRAAKRQRKSPVLDKGLAASRAVRAMDPVALSGRSQPSHTEKTDEDTESMPRCVVCRRATTTITPMSWDENRLARRVLYVGATVGGSS